MTTIDIPTKYEQIACYKNDASFNPVMIYITFA